MGFNLNSFTDFLKRLKASYFVHNLSKKDALQKNQSFYKEVGVKKSVLSSISSEDLPPTQEQDKPWLDQQAVSETAIRAKQGFDSFSPEVQAEILKWPTQGYAIVSGFMKKHADAVNGEIERLISSNEAKFRSSSERVMFANKQSSIIDDVTKDPELIRLLSFLLGKDVEPFQTLNFIKGSQQKAHSDSIHMTTYPEGYLVAVWVALEDMDAENGPLFYYPGSHTLPFTLNKDYDHGGNGLLLGKDAYANYEKKIAALIAEHNLQKEIFHAKKGDILIWNANLLHGGSPVLDPNRTRKSMAVHYFAKGVFCYHELTQRPAITTH